MPTYTVHEPPLRRKETAVNPDRFVFVRDGFYVWAFLLTPLWLILHRLWLVLILYLVSNAALMTVVHLFGIGGAGKALVAFFLSLLVGFEAGTLKRWTLTRRRYKARSVVVGDNLENAEQRFFSSWVTQPQDRPRDRVSGDAPKAIASGPMPRRAAPDVIGLFPQPDSRR